MNHNCFYFLSYLAGFFWLIQPTRQSTSIPCNHQCSHSYKFKPFKWLWAATGCSLFFSRRNGSRRRSCGSCLSAGCFGEPCSCIFQHSGVNYGNRRTWTSSGIFTASFFFSKATSFVVSAVCFSVRYAFQRCIIFFNIIRIKIEEI